MRIALGDAHYRPPVFMRRQAGMGDCQYVNGQWTADCYSSGGGYIETPQASTPANYLPSTPVATPTTPAPTNAGGNIIAQYQAWANEGIDPTAAADAVNELQSYCALNAQNNAMFGDPLDTATCAGSSPVSSLIAQASAITPGAVTPAQLPPAQPTPVLPAPVVTMPTPTAQAPIMPPPTTPSNPIVSTAIIPPATQPIAPTATAPSAPTSGFVLPSWLTATAIDGIPNWALGLGVVAGLFIVMSMSGGRR